MGQAGNYAKQATYNTIGTVTSLFCQWLIIMIIPKITNFAEAGIFSVAISVTSILNLLATMSLREYHVSDQNLHYSDTDFKYVRIITILLSFAGMIPFIIIFDYNYEEIAAIAIYLIYRSLLHYAYVFSASLQIHNHLDLVGKHTAIEGIVSFFSFTITYYALNNLLLSILVMSVMGGGAFLLLERRAYGKIVNVKKSTWNPAKIKQLLLIGFPFFLSVLAPALTTALPKLYVQYCCGDSIAGIFNTLAAPTVIIPTLAISVFAVKIPHFSNLSRRGDLTQIRKEYLKITLFLLLFGAACSVISVLFQSTIFGFLYGDEIVEYAKYFAYLIMGVVFYSIGITGNTVMITKKQGLLSAILASFSLIISVISCILFIPKMGIEGATYSMVLSYLTFGLLVSVGVCNAPLKKSVE